MWDATFAQRTTCYDKTQWLVGASRQLTRVTTALTSGHLLVLAHSNSLPDQRGPNIDHGTMPPGQSALVISCDCHKDWKQSTWGCSKTSQLPGGILPGFSLHSDSRHAATKRFTCQLGTKRMKHELANIAIGARWCKMVQDGARWCKMVQDGARWCKMVQDGARWCK